MYTERCLHYFGDALGLRACLYSPRRVHVYDHNTIIAHPPIDIGDTNLFSKLTQMLPKKAKMTFLWFAISGTLIRTRAFCSPGHFIGFNNLNKKEEIKLKKFLFKHQIRKKFQYSLEWEKNQLAIWDNRSMLHQATPFKGDRIMHRITIY